MNLATRLESMWWREQTPPWMLRLASRAYDVVNRHNLARRAAQGVRPAIPLISVGNITVGGSGKTPFVIWLCQELTARGHHPVVLCRGDGGRLKQPRRVLPGDAPEIVGDEALLLALRCSAPVIAGRDRVAGSRMAEALGDVIILDDGFQYRQLLRKCDIVLVPSTGIGNGCLLPAGPLRETTEALARADIVVRSGGKADSTLGFGREWQWQALVQPMLLLVGKEQAGPWLAVGGIARAARFFEAAHQCAEISHTLNFPDHHRYTPADVSRITAFGLPVLTTEKDAVKLLPLWPHNVSLASLPLKGHGEEGLPEAIIETMLRR